MSDLLPGLDWRRISSPGTFSPWTQTDEQRRAKKSAGYRKWAADKRDHLNAYKRKQRKENPERFRRAYERRQANPTQNLAARMRSSIRRAFEHKHVPSDKSRRAWETLVGYTTQELITHIERQFTGVMSWKNFGRWHIDHIRPVASFSFTTVDDPEFRECWALTNLRPMWGRENRLKAAVRVYLL
jgi:hypothetical protein